MTASPARRFTTRVGLILCSICFLVGCHQTLTVPLSGHVSIAAYLSRWVGVWVNQAVTDVIPHWLLRCGWLEAPIEDVALATTRAMETHDHGLLYQLIDLRQPEMTTIVHDAMNKLHQRSGEQIAGWRKVGPYPTHPWYEPLPRGTIVPMKVRMSFPDRQIDFMLLMQRTEKGWLVTDIQGL